MDKQKIPKIGSRYLINGNEYEVTAVVNNFITLRGVKTKNLRYLQVQDFMQNLDSRKIKLSVPAAAEITAVPTILDLNEKQRIAYERKVAYVVRLDKEINHSVPKVVVEETILEIAKKIGDSTPPSYVTITRWLRSYHEAGGNPIKLADKRKGKGRRKRLQPEAIQIIDEYIRSEYLTENRPTAQLVYSLVKSQIVVNNQNRPADKQLEIPSRATFYRVIEALDPFNTDTKRLGKAAAKKLHKYGRSIHKTTRLCERVEVDSHLIDVLVINEITRKIEGRPWLCAMLDVDSRCIIGWEISFTPPCAAKTLRALRMAMTEDSEKEIGGAPEVMILDNGAEFRNYSLQLVAGTYGVIIRYVAPRSPDEKPHIERFFGTLNTTFIHLMPGTTRSSPASRGDYASEKNATYTLAELREKFAFWLQNIYHATKHSELGMSPMDAWHQKARHYPPNRYPFHDLDVICRPFVYRSISNGRVSFDNLQWSGPSLSMLGSKAKASHNEKKFKVYYDDTDLAYVLIEDVSDRTNLIRADAVNPDYQNGLSLYEHRLIQSKRKQDYKDGDSVDLCRARLDFYLDLARSPSTGATKKIIARLQKTLPSQEEMENDESLPPQTEFNKPALPSEGINDEDDDGYEGYSL